MTILSRVMMKSKHQAVIARSSELRNKSISEITESYSDVFIDFPFMEQHGWSTNQAITSNELTSLAISLPFMLFYIIPYHSSETNTTGISKKHKHQKDY